MSVDRRRLIERIESLSDEDFERVGPHIEAELDFFAELDADDLEDMQRSIDRGLESARTEPLIDHEEVMRQARETLARRRPGS